jgi:hypothetical protein
MVFATMQLASRKTGIVHALFTTAQIAPRSAAKTIKMAFDANFCTGRRHVFAFAPLRAVNAMWSSFLWMDCI